jgi:hypothetical protein
MFIKYFTTLLFKGFLKSIQELAILVMYLRL